MIFFLPFDEIFLWDHSFFFAEILANSFTLIAEPTIFSSNAEIYQQNHTLGIYERPVISVLILKVIDLFLLIEISGPTQMIQNRRRNSIFHWRSILKIPFDEQ